MAFIPITRVVVDERARRLVDEVLDSGQLAQGPMVERLEQLLASAAGCTHAVAMSSGTSALVATLRSLDIGPGDEVITSPFTFAATINAIVEVGAVARFADIGDDYTINPEAVADLIGERTAAIMPVHLYGLMTDMALLEPLARRHSLVVIEDAAQAIGAECAGRRAGSFGVGCFSMYATKNVSTGEGGAVTTSDPDLAERLRVMRNQGMRQPYEYLFPGSNYRLTDLQAAIGIPQMEDLEEITKRRRANAEFLAEHLGSVEGLMAPSEPGGRVHVYHQFTVRVTDEAPLQRDQLADALRKKDVGSGVYYPRPAFDYPCYREHANVIDSDPVPHAFEVSRQVLSLPVHPRLTQSDLESIVGAVHSSWKR